MVAALTIAVILAFSVAIVRVASVAMRLTGLPENVARFQCLSALTGTGFTTGESEMIVNFPVRRKILVALMVVGNLGIVSIGTTFVVALTRTDEGTDALLFQLIALLAAVALIAVMSLSASLDRIMCGMAAKILRKTTELSSRGYRTLLQLDNGLSVAEHRIDRKGFDIGQLVSEHPDARVLAVRLDGSLYIAPSQITANDREAYSGVIVFGTEEAHRLIENRLCLPSSA